MNPRLALRKDDMLHASPLAAMLLREARAAVLNRYVQVASSVALIGGIAAVFLSEDAGAVAFLLLQISLYFVTLFALLAGVSSALAEAEEWPILMAQPMPRSIFVLGKFLALLAIFAAIVVVLFLPAAFVDESPVRLFTLAAMTLAIAAVFGSVGIFVGIRAGDRVQGLVLAVTAWVFLLFGYGLAALFLAQIPFVQSVGDLWVFLLMLNPADAFRIQALFALEQIPPEATTKTALAQWWLTNSTLWSALISIAWGSVLLLLTASGLRKRDLC